MRPDTRPTYACKTALTLDASSKKAAHEAAVFLVDCLSSDAKNKLIKKLEFADHRIFLDRLGDILLWEL